MCAKRAKRTGVNLLLFFFSLGIALLAAEFALHYIWGFGATIGPKLFCEYDPVLGWRKAPGKEGWLEKKGVYRVFEKINSKGLRGPECPYDKPEGEFRILVLGDSFVEGYFVSLEDLFIQRLEDALNARGDGRRYRVINGGTGGYSTDQELLFFQNEGRKYEPDLVLLVVCCNDMWFTTRGSFIGARGRCFKPLFRLNGNQLILTNVPLPKFTPPRAKTRRNLTLKQWLNKNSITYSFVRKELKRISWLNNAAIRMGLAQKEAPAKTVDGKAKEVEITSVPPLLTVFQDPSPPQIEKAWRITEALLQELKRQVEMAGARLMILYAPIKGRVQWGARAEAIKRKYGLKDLDKPSRNLELICNKLSLPFTDPTGYFRQEIERCGEHLYYERDGHWNARGNEVVARILLEHIESNVLGDRESSRTSARSAHE